MTIARALQVADAEVDLSRPVFRPDGAPPRPAALEMLQRLVIPGELDLRGWDPDEPQEEVDGWRNEQGISTRWGCFACSDSRYMHNKRRFHDSEVGPPLWDCRALCTRSLIPVCIVKCVDFDLLSEAYLICN